MKTKPVALAARAFVHQQAQQRKPEHTMTQEALAKAKDVITDQAEMLFEIRRELSRVSGIAQQFQQQLQVAAKELATTKEALEKATANLAADLGIDAPARSITEAQALAELYGLPRPAPHVTAAEFIATNAIAPPSIGEQQAAEAEG